MAKKKATATEGPQEARKPIILHCRMRSVDMEMIDSLVASLDTIDRTSLIRQLVKDAYTKEQKRRAREQAK